MIYFMANFGMGPYKVEKSHIRYLGNKVFSPIEEVRGIKPSDLSLRHQDLKRDRRWQHLMIIYDSLHEACRVFMKEIGAIIFDLPIITRMISSPGALSGTIPSDVEPFRLQFFKHETFLTQSSQLYLEFTLNTPEIDRVYCWEKSFRREKADFRHLPEFTHIEFEAKINFDENLKVQENFLRFIINYLLRHNRLSLSYFLEKENLKKLESFSR